MDVPCTGTAPNPCLPARPGRTDLGGPCIPLLPLRHGCGIPILAAPQVREGLQYVATGLRGGEARRAADVLRHLHTAFLSLYAQCTAGRKGMAVGIGMLRRTVPHVHAHTVEDARVGAYLHQAGCLRCGYGDAALHGLCQRSGVQPLHQQHHHPAAGQHGAVRFSNLSADHVQLVGEGGGVGCPGRRGTKCAGGRLVGTDVVGLYPRAVDVQV